MGQYQNVHSVPCKPYCVYLSFPSELLDEVDGDGAALAQREVVPVLQYWNLVLRVHLKVINLVAPSSVLYCFHKRHL